MNGGQADRSHRVRQVRRHRVTADQGPHPRGQVPAAALELLNEGAHNRGHSKHHGDPIAPNRVQHAARIKGTRETQRHQRPAARPHVHRRAVEAADVADGRAHAHDRRGRRVVEALTKIRRPPPHDLVGQLNGTRCARRSGREQDSRQLAPAARGRGAHRRRAIHPGSQVTKRRPVQARGSQGERSGGGGLVVEDPRGPHLRAH